MLRALSHRVQHARDARADAEGRRRTPSVTAEVLHFLGEVEVVFGLWAVVLFAAMVGYHGWEHAKHYFNDEVNYTEALFVVVIMSLAATRPIVSFAENALRRIANAGRGTPGAWWVTILIIGPILGSFITEPAAMTICALLLARQFYDLNPGTNLKYATLGLLFVNVSIGGHADAFRGAAGAHGGAALGLVDIVHARPLRLARRDRDRRLDRDLLRDLSRRARRPGGAADHSRYRRARRSQGHFSSSPCRGG